MDHEFKLQGLGAQWSIVSCLHCTGQLRWAVNNVVHSEQPSCQSLLPVSAATVASIVPSRLHGSTHNPELYRDLVMYHILMSNLDLGVRGWLFHTGSHTEVHSLVCDIGSIA